jgi:hypothetical protein
MERDPSCRSPAAAAAMPCVQVVHRTDVDRVDVIARQQFADIACGEGDVVRD